MDRMKTERWKCQSCGHVVIVDAGATLGYCPHCDHGQRVEFVKVEKSDASEN